MKIITMDIQEIKLRVDLLKKVSQQKTVLISDVAKELKVRKTDLMILIEDNPKLFHTDEIWSWKKQKSVSCVIGGKKYYDVRDIRDKCRGLGITQVFLVPEDNWRTEEFAAKMKAKYAKTVWLSDWNNYGYIEGQYVRRDGSSEKGKQEHLWRNTDEKIQELQHLGILFTKNFYIGGAFDSSTHRIETAIDDDRIKEAETLGWTIIKPESK